MPQPVVEIIHLNHSGQTVIPQFATAGSAAIDLVADICEPITLNRHQSQMIPSGIKVSMQPGMVALLVPRSSTGSKGYSLKNTIGVIDSDYQGEIKMNIVNTSTETIVVEPGMRLAQLLFLNYIPVTLHPVESFSISTERGEGGFGSTGQ